MSSLSGKFISETYHGLLHTDGAIDASGLSIVYDGDGNLSDFKIGRSGNGASVTGTLTVGDLKVGDLNFPSVAGTAGNLLYLSSSNTVSFTDNIDYTLINPLSPSPAGTYNNIDKIVVNSRGLVTSVSESDDSDKPFSVTKTVYLQGAVSRSTITLNPNNNTWVKVDLPSSWEGFKSGIFFIKPFKENGDQRLEAEDRKIISIIASPDKTLEYNILHVVGGEDSGGGADWWGIGAQFMCPIDGNSPAIYFKLDDSTTSTIPQAWKIILIAKQK